jgi:hypothetical protein
MGNVKKNKKTNSKEEKAKKKGTHAKWAKPTTSQGVTVPQKEGHARKQSNGPA